MWVKHLFLYKRILLDQLLDRFAASDRSRVVLCAIDDY